MDPREYQDLAARTEGDYKIAARRYFGPPQRGFDATDPTTTLPVRLNHAVNGLTGEVGELAGALERWLHYGQPLDVSNIRVGDCMWYIALACNTLDLDLGKVMAANIQKLRVRYPERYTDEHAAEVNRDREAERRTLDQ